MSVSCVDPAFRYGVDCADSPTAWHDALTESLGSERNTSRAERAFSGALRPTAEMRNGVRRLGGRPVLESHVAATNNNDTSATRRDGSSGWMARMVSSEGKSCHGLTPLHRGRRTPYPEGRDEVPATDTAGETPGDSRC